MRCNQTFLPELILGLVIEMLKWPNTIKLIGVN